jgi:hypothetical protein
MWASLLMKGSRKPSTQVDADHAEQAARSFVVEERQHVPAGGHVHRDEGAEQAEQRSRGADHRLVDRRAEAYHDAATEQGDRVEQQETQAAERAFEGRSQAHEGRHVERDVHETTMQEATRQQAPRFAIGGEVGTESAPFPQLLARRRERVGQHGHSDATDQDHQGHRDVVDLLPKVRHAPPRRPQSFARALARNQFSSAVRRCLLGSAA